MEKTKHYQIIVGYNVSLFNRFVNSCAVAGAEMLGGVSVRSDGVFAQAMTWEGDALKPCSYRGIDDETVYLGPELADELNAAFGSKEDNA